MNENLKRTNNNLYTVQYMR